MAIQIKSVTEKTASNGNKFRAVEFADGSRATMWAGKTGYDLLASGATVEVTTSETQKDGKVYRTLTSVTPAMAQAVASPLAQIPQTQPVVVSSPEPKLPRYEDAKDKRASIEGQQSLTELGLWFRSDKKMPLVWQTAYLMAIKQKMEGWGVVVEGKAIDAAIEGLNKPTVTPEAPVTESSAQKEPVKCPIHKDMVLDKKTKTGQPAHVFVDEAGAKHTCVPQVS